MTGVEIRARCLTRPTHLNLCVQQQKESMFTMTGIIHAINGKTQPSIAGQSIVLNALNVYHWDICLHPQANTARVGMMQGMGPQAQREVI
jgi:hypothetical protein